MEFTQLVSPSGEWGKIWLAAHWEKKLKKQDYVEIDLRALLASFLARRAILSLRATGHLLVGGCRVFARKCQILEEEVLEVRQRLWLAFSDCAARRQGDGDDAAGGRPLGALLREVDAELAEHQDQAALLGGKRHVARLEDITLRPPSVDLAAACTAGLGGEELFGAMSRAELESALRELAGIVLPPGPGGPGPTAPGGDGGPEGTGPDTQPLVGGGAPLEEARGSKRPLESDTALTDLDTPAPLDMDLPPPRDDDDLEPPRGLGMEEPDEFGMADEAMAERMPDMVDGDTVKRRRRGKYIFDEVTEIPKATYQAYMNDRSAITRDKILDYTIVLPHYSPSLPEFTTTFTDLCPQLTDCLRRGREVAEKLRRQRQDREMAALPGREAEPLADALRAGQPLLPVDPGTSAAAEALLRQAVGGQPGAAGPGPPAGPPALTERSLLKEAPRTLSAAVLAGGGAEDQPGAAEARVGYSGRTEKMHRYLAREFHEAHAEALSYEKLCRLQAAGRRELLAGGFFELLVLKTNGVIGLRQESPQSDIQISKASQWSA